MHLVQEQAISVEQKEALVKDLLEALDFENGYYKNWSDDGFLRLIGVVGEAVTVLRLLSRERVGFEGCLNETVLECLALHAGLGIHVPNDRTSSIVIESLKCISNIQIHQPDLRSWFGKSDYVKNIPQILKVSMSSGIVVFMLIRLSFLASANNQELSQYFINQNLPDLYSSILEQSLDGKLDDSQISKLQLQEEVLKASFSLTLLIPTPSNQGQGLFSAINASNLKDNIPYFNNLLQSIIRTLKALPVTEPPLNVSVASAINSLMNFSVSELSEVWFPEGDLQNVEFISKIFDDTVCYLFPITESIKGEPSESIMLNQTSCDQALAPILILLKNLASDSLEARNWLRNHYLPLDLDRSVPLNTGKRMVNYLVRFMTSLNCDQIRDCTSEFVFAMCSCNVDAFVSYLGYGNTAGFLMNRGMFGGLPQPGSKEYDQFPENIDPITGTFKKETPNPLDGMTEEEKEREAEKLFVLFDRLNKTGMFQPINPFDPGNK